MSSRRRRIIGVMAVVGVVAVGVGGAFAAGWLVQRPNDVGVAFDNTKGVVSGKLFVQVGPRPATPISGRVALVNVAQISGAAYSPPWVTTGPDGTFSVSVDPGIYQAAATVTGTSPFYRGGRRACTIPGGTVRVHAGDHINVNVQCQTGWP